MTTERDVKQMADALLGLQNQYVALIEEGDSESEGAFSYYRELADDVAKKTQVSSKYARQLLANQHFHEAFTIVSGETLDFRGTVVSFSHARSAVSASLYMPMLTIVETSVTFHLDLAKTLMDEVQIVTNGWSVYFM